MTSFTTQRLVAYLKGVIITAIILWLIAPQHFIFTLCWCVAGFMYGIYSNEHDLRFTDDKEYYMKSTYGHMLAFSAFFGVFVAVIVLCLATAENIRNHYRSST
jgi:hypothetical protein